MGKTRYLELSQHATSYVEMFLLLKASGLIYDHLKLAHSFYVSEIAAVAAENSASQKSGKQMWVYPVELGCWTDAAFDYGFTAAIFFFWNVLKLKIHPIVIFKKSYVSEFVNCF